MSAFQQQTDQYVQQIKAGSNTILVSVRVRPLSQKQKRVSPFETIKVLEGKLLSLMEPDNSLPVDVLRKNRSKQIQYAFDFVFDQNTATKTIYQENVSILMDGLLEGYNASILAYGATSCGKTYTMVGENDNTPGIMAMAVMELLNIAQEHKSEQVIKLKASYIEIYNENVKDLLISEDKNLQIREDPKEGIQIPGVTQVLIDNLSQLKTVLKVGSKNRTKESTGCNEASSRSHGIFIINVENRSRAQSTFDQTIFSKLSLIDLAGSERASNTTNKGIRMVQGAKINQSLLVLGNCIQALSEASEKGLKNAFVPYRGSKLTRLLKDSLGGNCRTVMIAHISPAVHLFEETYKTLVYAHRAKNIKNNPIRNTLIAETHLSNYVNVINNLKRENQELKHKIKLKQYTRNNQTIPSLPVVPTAAYKEEITRLQEVVNRHFMQEEQIMKKITEIEIKMDEFAFQIYTLQVTKANQKQIEAKNKEAAELSKEKIKYETRFEQKKQARNKIIGLINKNEVLGQSGQTVMNNFYKEKKVELQSKFITMKDQAIKAEKKLIKVFLRSIKKSIINKQELIERQKILIKKNNIKSQVTYTELPIKKKQQNFANQNQIYDEQKLQIKSPRLNIQKSTTKRAQESQKINEIKNVQLRSIQKQKEPVKVNFVKNLSTSLKRLPTKKTIQKNFSNQIRQFQSLVTNAEKAIQKTAINSPRKQIQSPRRNKLKSGKNSKSGPSFDFIYLAH